MYPRVVGHIGINVLDIQKQVDWYCDVFGFRLLTPIVEVDLSEDTIRNRSGKDMLGKEVKRFKIARICAGNGVAIEFFQYMDIDGGIPKSNISAHNHGWVHICITDENIEELMQRVVDYGGSLRSAAHQEGEGTNYKCAYCQDPEGIIIELATHSSEQMYANTF